ncbi:hypothetical protein ACFLYV_02220 [Chloroflexota bacterium]
MLIAVAVLASLVMAGWLVYRAVKQKPVRAHMISRALAYITGLYTYAFFLTVDIPQLFKVVVSIILGAAFIVLASYIQRRRQAD